MLSFGSVAAKDLLINGRPKFFEKRPYSKCECCISKRKKFGHTRNNHGIYLFKSENANNCKHTKFLELSKSQQLQSEEKDGFTRSVNVKESLLDSKILDTLWKLYREPGETVEEVQHRLVDHVISEQFTDSKNTEIYIKKENENYTEEYNIEDSEEMGEKNASIIKNSFDLGDILAVEIIESNESVQLTNDQESFNITEEYKKNKTLNLTALYSRCSDSFKSSLNCTHGSPRIRPMTNAEQITNSLFFSNRNENSVAFKTVINQEKSDNIEGNKVVDCEMYDTKTINNNLRTPKMINRKSLKTSLSAISIDDEIEFAITKKDEMSSIVIKNCHKTKRKILNYEYERDSTYATFQMSSDSDDSNFTDNSRRKKFKWSHVENKHSNNFLLEEAQ